MDKTLGVGIIPFRNVEKKVCMDSQANELATSPFSAPPTPSQTINKFLVKGHLFGKRVNGILVIRSASFFRNSTWLTDRYNHNK